MKKFTFIVWYFLVFSTDSKIMNNVKPYKIECFPSAEFAPNVSCSLKPIDRKTTVINAETDLIKPLTDVVVRGQVFRRYNTFQPFLIKYVEHSCSIFTGKSNAIFSKLSKGILQAYTNLNHSCPYEGKLIARNLKYIDGAFLSIIPSGVYRVDLTVSEKIEKNVAFILKIYAEITEETRN